MNETNAEQMGQPEGSIENHFNYAETFAKSDLVVPLHIAREQVRAQSARIAELERELEIERGENEAGDRILKDQDEEIAELKRRRSEQDEELSAKVIQLRELERRVEEAEQELSQRPYCVCKFTDPEPNRFGCAKASDLIWTTRCSLHNGFVAPIESELSQLRVEVEALNGKLTAAILGSQAEVERLTKERDVYAQCNRTALDGLDALRAQLAEREEDRWQPIETAPKDGRQILVYFQNDLDGMSLVCVRWLRERWVVGRLDNGDSVVQNSRLPLGWQPLPQPPAIRAARAQEEDGK